MQEYRDQDGRKVSMGRDAKLMKGLAISVILLALVLLAAITVAIAIAGRSSNSNTIQQQARLNASTILEEGGQFRIGFEKMTANGVDPSTITFDAAPGTGLWNPASGGTSQQFFSASICDVPGCHWVYHSPGQGSELKLMNIGTGSGNYAVALAHITLETCQLINTLLTGSSSIPNVNNNPSSNWSGIGNPWAVDFSADPATDGRVEICIALPSGTLAYYKTLLEQ